MSDVKTEREHIDGLGRPQIDEQTECWDGRGQTRQIGRVKDG
jgi:hypothetical protein